MTTRSSHQVSHGQLRLPLSLSPLAASQCVGKLRASRELGDTGGGFRRKKDNPPRLTVNYEADFPSLRKEGGGEQGSQLDGTFHLADSRPLDFEKRAYVTGPYAAPNSVSFFCPGWLVSDARCRRRGPAWYSSVNICIAHQPCPSPGCVGNVPALQKAGPKASPSPSRGHVSVAELVLQCAPCPPYIPILSILPLSSHLRRGQRRLMPLPLYSSARRCGSSLIKWSRSGFTSPWLTTGKGVKT